MGFDVELATEGRLSISGRRRLRLREIVPAGLAPHYANPTAATDLVAATSAGLRTE
ncbi:hypothetical protein RER_08660 [Rhodococcus erythropolis PR4]|uniref:Uncharacterized protein n=1 Tax=Rhodococcus erythropolis (strain PR4 / NBRC 100887) TaxID=234621 RepID=C0ZQ96_RHOE4|nr:hypothetical protein G418_23706 [Rhodococcus qingshengii BKS 20-40]BAH31574.1 hypothetical protein RER_08660 [Rhodococcus erythropolis PR4]